MANSLYNVGTPLTDAMRGYMMGTKFRQQQEQAEAQQKQQAGIQEFMPGALMGDPEAFKNLAAIAPQEAMQVGQQLQQQQKAKQQQQQFQLQQRQQMTEFLTGSLADLSKIKPENREAFLAQKQKEGTTMFGEAFQPLATSIIGETPEMKSQLLSIYGDQVDTAQTKIGTYNPRDYTTESWSEFVQTRDPNVLERFTTDPVVKENIRYAGEIIREKEQHPEELVNWARTTLGQEDIGGQKLFGALSVDKGTNYYEGALSAQSAYDQLARQLNILEDMRDKGISLKGAAGQNFMQSWFGEVLGVSETEAQEYASAVATGNFDIARQLAQALKPVSGEQLRLVLKSLEGGNVPGAIQSIRSTLNQTEKDYNKNRRILKSAKAGIIDDLPDKLKFKRKKDVLRREDVTFSGQQQSIDELMNKYNPGGN